MWVVAAVAATVMGSASAAPALVKAKPEVIDLGAAEYVAGQEQVSVTVVLNLRNTDQIEPLLRATYTAGGPGYRKFLSPQEFAAKFGPTPETIARVTQHFQKAGLQVAQLTATHLGVSGRTAAIKAEFGVQLHAFEAAPTATSAGYTFRSPSGAAQINSAIADAVQSVEGLDTRPHFRPHLMRSADLQSSGKLPAVPARHGTGHQRFAGGERFIRAGGSSGAEHVRGRGRCGSL
jgi:subtilase family serine protease